MARKADVIGQEDVGKRVGNVIVIKVRAAVQRRLEAVDADALLLCFAGLWGNLSASSSSSSDLVSANKRLFCHLYFVFSLRHTDFLNNMKKTTVCEVETCHFIDTDSILEVVSNFRFDWQNCVKML